MSTRKRRPETRGCPFFPLFAYGTLMRDGSNHWMVSDAAQGILPAGAGPARLWHSEGLPILELSPKVRLHPRISADPRADKELYLRVAQGFSLARAFNLDLEPGPGEVEDALHRPWRVIQGELMFLPDDPSLIRSLDHFGEVNQDEPLYARSLTGVFLADNTVFPAWLYHFDMKGADRPWSYFPHDRWSARVASYH